MKLNDQMKKEIIMVERKYFIKAIRQANFDRMKAAKILNISRAQFFRKMNQLGLKIKQELWISDK